MFCQFAMTPDIFCSEFLDSNNDPNGIILIEILRGITQYGVLANLDKGNWIRHVKERANFPSPTIRDKVLTCLTTLDNRKRLVRYPKSSTGSPSTDFEWLNLVLSSHKTI